MRGETADDGPEVKYQELPSAPDLQDDETVEYLESGEMNVCIIHLLKHIRLSRRITPTLSPYG